MNNLIKRILVGLIGIPLILGLLWLGGWWFSALVVVISALALHEFYVLGDAKHAHANWLLGIGFGVALQAHIAALLLAPDIVWQPTEVVCIGFMVVLLIVELFRNRENPVLNVAATVLGILYVSVPMTTLIALRQMSVNVDGSAMPVGWTLVLVMFIGIWVCDSAAYFVGMRFGKHKLFPRVSPGKSWEGAIAGFIVSCTTVVGLMLWLMPWATALSALGAGVIIATTGQLGDLVESLFKRDAGVKDSSALIPGHGGFLDRFDSIILAAPALYVYLTIITQ